jgi:hypothetical protein
MLRGLKAQKIIIREKPKGFILLSFPWDKKVTDDHQGWPATRIRSSTKKKNK